MSAHAAGARVTAPFADRPLPAWHDDAKLGIFIHWGPYAVPCYAPMSNDMGEMMEHGNWADAFRCTPYVEWYLNSWTIEGSPSETFGERKALGPSPRQFGTNLKRASKRVGDDLVHDPHFVGTRSRYGQPPQDHLERPGLTDDSGQALGAATTWKNADAGLWQSDCGNGMSDDAQVARQRKLEASAHA